MHNVCNNVTDMRKCTHHDMPFYVKERERPFDMYLLLGTVGARAEDLWPLSCAHSRASGHRVERGVAPSGRPPSASRVSTLVILLST